MTILDRYDAAVIGEMAKRLLSKADRLVIFYTLFGVLVGMVLAMYALQTFSGMKIVAAPMFGIAVVIGYRIGQERAFSFRLRAQLLLCQARIEDNTAALLRQQQPVVGMSHSQ